MTRFFTLGPRPFALVAFGLAAGCSCQQEYAFPAPDQPVFLDPPADQGSWLSMDTTPDGGRLTIAYYDREAGAVAYAIGTPQSDGTVTWQHEAVDGFKGSDGLDRGDRGKYASQKTAPDGTVWVAYQDAANGGLYVAHRLGGPVWGEPELVDPGAGAWASLAIGADGHPVVAHHHEDDGVLRVSRFDGAAWSTETVWTGQDWSGIDPATGAEITREANVGQYVRLVVHDGVEYLAFYDAAQQGLSLLEGGPDGYTHTIVDHQGDVGQWPSIWTDGTTLAIAYQDVGQQDLKLATREAGSWSHEVVDAGEYRGADTEVFRRGDKTAIAYFDGFENDMLLATQDGGSWVIETVGGATGAVGFHNEVAKIGETVWLGSYDFSAHALFVASTN